MLFCSNMQCCIFAPFPAFTNRTIYVIASENDIFMSVAILLNKIDFTNEIATPLKMPSGFAMTKWIAMSHKMSSLLAMTYSAKKQTALTYINRRLIIRAWRITWLTWEGCRVSSAECPAFCFQAGQGPWQCGNVYF